MKTEAMFDLWDDLLIYARDGRVVPIVGPELLTVAGPEGPTNLYKIVAEQLADQLHVSKDGLDPARPLDDIVGRYLSARGKRQRLYTGVTTVLDSLQVGIPDSLRKLVELPQIKLFVTTTCDSLLELAIKSVRPRAVIRRLDYAPGNVKDLPANIGPDEVIVYHLLGVRSSAPTFVLTEEDLLEFVCDMQKNKPARLFDELSRNHLLFVGTGFPDWLARLFIRVTKGMKLSQPRDYQEFLVDKSMGCCQDLVLFLHNFSQQTEIYADGNAEDFVSELHRRYFERFPAPVNRIEPAASPPPDRSAHPPAIFISYVHEDIAAGEAVRNALQSAGIDVWFDKRGLEGGDDFSIKIQRAIKDCILFIPLISATTRRRDEGYFRREWSLANQRAEHIAEGIPFIIPTAIDDTPESEDAMVPSQFLELHWQRIRGGVASEAYIKRIVDLVRQHRARREGARL